MTTTDYLSFYDATQAYLQSDQFVEDAREWAELEDGEPITLGTLIVYKASGDYDRNLVCFAQDVNELV